MDSKEFDAELNFALQINGQANSKADKWRKYNQSKPTPPIMKQKFANKSTSNNKKCKHINNIINSHGDTFKFTTQHLPKSIHPPYSLTYITPSTTSSFNTKSIGSLKQMKIFHGESCKAQSNILKISPLNGTREVIKNKIKEIRVLRYGATNFKKLLQPSGLDNIGAVGVFSADIIGQSIYKLEISKYINIIFNIKPGYKCNKWIDQTDNKYGKYIISYKGEIKTEISAKKFILMPCIIIRKNKGDEELYCKEITQHSMVQISICKNIMDNHDVKYIKITSCKKNTKNIMISWEKTYSIDEILKQQNKIQQEIPAIQPAPIDLNLSDAHKRINNNYVHNNGNAFTFNDNHYAYGNTYVPNQPHQIMGIPTISTIPIKPTIPTLPTPIKPMLSNIWNQSINNNNYAIHPSSYAEVIVSPFTEVTEAIGNDLNDHILEASTILRLQEEVKSYRKREREWIEKKRNKVKKAKLSIDENTVKYSYQ
eukprot:90118_1